MRCIAIFLLLFGLSVDLFSQDDKARIEVTGKLLKDIRDSQHQLISAYVDEEFRKIITPEILIDGWKSLISLLGDVKSTGAAVSVSDDSLHLVEIICVFDKGSFKFRAAFNDRGFIVGVFFTPILNIQPYEDPPYTDFNIYTSRQFSIQSGKYTLPAKFTTSNKEGKRPVIILVHGSGPNDWDESIGANKPFRDLAIGLACLSDIATIRYHKRTKVYGAEMARNSDSLTVLQETIEDVIAAVKIAKEFKEVDSTKIYLLGHSLGGMLCPRIAMLCPELAGIIIMAGNARPLEDLILEQTKYLLSDGGLIEEELEAIKLLEVKVNAVKDSSLSVHTPTSSLPLNIPAAYWMDLKQYDQLTVAQNLNMRILILQGERDYQVTMTDYSLWEKFLQNKKDVEFHSYPKLNHLFMEGEGKSTPDEYDEQNNIPFYVIKDIDAWILQGLTDK